MSHKLCDIMYVINFAILPVLRFSLMASQAMTPENDPNQIRFPKFCHRIFWMVFLIETLICFRYPLNLREKNSRFIKISNPLFWWCPARCSSRFFMITDSNRIRYTKICDNDTFWIFFSTLPFVFSVYVFINIE